MTDDHSHDHGPSSTGYFPPAEVLVPQLQQEIANLNNERVMLRAQVEFQAQIIESLQRQLADGSSKLDEASMTDRVVAEADGVID